MAPSESQRSRKDWAQAKTPTDHLMFLVEASSTLSSALEYPEVARRIADLVIPYLADWCAVDIVREGLIVRQEVAASAPEKQAALREVFERSPPGWDSPHPASQAMRTRKPVLISDPSAAANDSACAPFLRQITHLGPVSILAVPVFSRDVVLGAITLYFAESRRHYASDDIALAEELARRTAIAEENARLFLEARSASHLRDKILAIVAHDLRSPLATVMAASSLLANRADQPEQTEMPLRAIQRSVRRMERLIEDLLDVAAIEAGRLRLRPLAVDIAEVVRASCENLAPQLTGKRLVCTYADGLPELNVDADRLHQVIANLVGNAAKHAPTCGEIHVDVATQESGVRIVVADDGPGILPSELPHLFDRFWQSSRTRKGGAGLGLPISKGIVEAHGGTIEAASVPGRGTSISITLPTPWTPAP